MSLTGLGEKIMKHEVADSKDAYVDQLNTFYSYCRWYQILQQLGKKKNEALANLLSRMGLFMHVFAACHMDDHMVDLLGREDAELLYELRLFAALDEHTLETFRTGWVRLQPPARWPTAADKPVKEIRIPQGTVVHPVGDSTYSLMTVIPWVMTVGDTKLPRPGVTIPVRTVTNVHITDLPPGRQLELVVPNHGITRAVNPAAIKKRSAKNHDLARVLHDTLTKDMLEPAGVSGDVDHPDRDETKELAKEGLDGSHPRLLRVWMERHTSEAWKYGLFVGQFVEYGIGITVALRLTSYVDLLTGDTGLVRGTLSEIMKAPFRFLGEASGYKKLRRWRGRQGKKWLSEPDRTFKERWENTKKYYKTRNVRRRAQLKRIKKFFSRRGVDLDVNEPLQEPLAEADLQPAIEDFSPGGYAEDLGVGDVGVGDAIKMGAVDAEMGGASIDVEENMLDAKMRQGNDLLDDKVADRQASVRRGSFENADEEIKQQIREEPTVRTVVEAENDPAAINSAEESGGKADVLDADEGFEAETEAMEGESMVADAAGIVLFLAIDIVMGVIESYKEKEAWDEAADEVQEHVNTMGERLKTLIKEYEDQMSTYQQTLATWNMMLTDVFVDPQTHQVQMYPALMPVEQGEHDPYWYKSYVPIDGRIFDSEEFLHSLLEDGLPREIKDVSDPKHFVGELKKEDAKSFAKKKYDWSAAESGITWKKLAEIAGKKGFVKPDPARFDGSTSFAPVPLNVYDHWSEHFTLNLALIFKFRTDLIRFVTNQQKKAKDGWPQMVDKFVKAIENNIEFGSSFLPGGRKGFFAKYPAFAAAHPPAPPEAWKSGTADQKLRYYSYIYDFLVDKNAGRGIKRSLLPPKPSPGVKKSDLHKQVDQHIEIFAEENARTDQEEYVRELKKVAKKFCFYSDLLLAGKITKAREAPVGAELVTVQSLIVGAGPPADGQEAPTAAPRGSSIQALISMADFIHAFLELERSDDGTLLASRAADLFPAGLRHSVPPDFPAQQATRFMDRLRRRWATPGESDDLWDVPGFARMAATDGAGWARLMRAAAPTFQIELERFRKRVVYAETGGAPMGAVIRDVADALFDLQLSIDEEIDKGRLDINAEVLRMVRRAYPW